MSNLYKSGQIAAKTLLSKQGRMTSQEIINHVKDFPEFRNITQLKKYILKPLFKDGKIVKKIDHAIINPRTKMGTFYWEMPEDVRILDAYKQLTRENSNNFEIDPIDKVELRPTVPLLGRTGAYANFAKRAEWSGDVDEHLKRQLE